MLRGKKTGGRQKGTPNRVTRQREAEIAAAGTTPLQYMLAVMRDETAEPQRRDDMARAAAPFCHPRLAAVDLSGVVTTRYVAEIPAVAATTAEWEAQHVPPQYRH